MALRASTLEDFLQENKELWLRLMKLNIPPPGQDWRALQAILITEATERNASGFSSLVALGLRYLRLAQATDDDFDVCNYAAADYYGTLFEISKVKQFTKSDQDLWGAAVSGFSWRATFAARWAQGAFPVLRLRESVVSELIMCDPDREGFKSPWRAFVVLPQGGWDFPREERLRYIEFMQNHTGLYTVATNTTKERYYSAGVDLQEMTKPDDLTGFGAESDELRRNLYNEDIYKKVVFDDVDKHINLFGRRLGAAACSAVVAGEPVKRWKKTKKSNQGYSVSTPAHFVEYILGDTVEVHKLLTEAARAVLRREPQQHTVRWTVRGHFRNQACGPQKKERRKVWIRPYYKGPAGAPTLLRDHSL